MIKYIHKFKVSSGKGRREITKVYDNWVVAKEQHKLLGGSVEVVRALYVWEEA